MLGPQCDPAARACPTGNVTSPAPAKRASGARISTLPISNRPSCSRRSAVPRMRVPAYIGEYETSQKVIEGSPSSPSRLERTTSHDRHLLRRPGRRPRRRRFRRLLRHRAARRHAVRHRHAQRRVAVFADRRQSADRQPQPHLPRRRHQRARRHGPRAGADQHHRRRARPGRHAAGRHEPEPVGPEPDQEPRGPAHHRLPGPGGRVDHRLRPHRHRQAGPEDHRGAGRAAAAPGRGLGAGRGAQERQGAAHAGPVRRAGELHLQPRRRGAGPLDAAQEAERRRLRRCAGRVRQVRARWRPRAAGPGAPPQ